MSGTVHIRLGLLTVVQTPWMSLGGCLGRGGCELWSPADHLLGCRAAALDGMVVYPYGELLTLEHTLPPGWHLPHLIIADQGGRGGEG